MSPRGRISGLDRVGQLIHLLRGQRVMLDSDLARLDGVSTKALVQALKRNAERFPSDFMFQLTASEMSGLRSQSVTSNGRGGRRWLPHAFTEQGVAMLSSVLRSTRAIQVNIEIMRTFVRLRHPADTRAQIMRRIDHLEVRVGKHDEAIAAVFDAMRKLVTAPPPRTRIGFCIARTKRSDRVRSQFVTSHDPSPRAAQRPGGYSICSATRRRVAAP